VAHIVPVDIETLKAEGKPVEGRVKKSDKEELIKTLSEQGYTIKELAEMFGAARGTIYNHLKKLREEGLVKAYKVGNQVFYAAETE